MEIINFDNPLFLASNKIEEGIFLKGKKIPEFVFALPFPKYYFLWDSASFNTSVYNKFALPLMRTSIAKQAILTSLNPHSDGRNLMKFKFDFSDSEKEFIEAMNYDPINKDQSNSLMYATTTLALYSIDKSWALVGDSWDTDITILAIKSTLDVIIDKQNVKTAENIEDLLFFINDPSKKKIFLSKIMNNYT